ncbi:Hypp5422 [Branchiostoma lanceolatum]|uniref:Hypp5422 protein n=1 Tax=Branchiostoma lanceolatum TaxID=7740 RepID=A0A8J9W1T5_BRALA|nr:Hypp5422 [Branchiostoma lanceolatum]
MRYAPMTSRLSSVLSSGQQTDTASACAETVHGDVSTRLTQQKIATSLIRPLTSICVPRSRDSHVNSSPESQTASTQGQAASTQGQAASTQGLHRAYTGRIYTGSTQAASTQGLHRVYTGRIYTGPTQGLHRVYTGRIYTGSTQGLHRPHLHRVYTGRIYTGPTQGLHRVYTGPTQAASTQGLHRPDPRLNDQHAPEEHCLPSWSRTTGLCQQSGFQVRNSQLSGLGPAGFQATEPSGPPR